MAALAGVGRGHAAIAVVGQQAELCFNMHLQKADRQLHPTDWAETCFALLI